MAALYISIIILVVLGLARYVPVKGIPMVNMTNLDPNKVTILDVRDFNESYKSAVAGAINIPVAYLNRSLNELPGNEVHLLVANSLEKNISVRLLRKKGYRVSGFTLLAPSDHSTNDTGIEIETSF